VRDSLTPHACARRGTGWGEAGYMKMGRGMKYKNPVHGECDVLGLGLYPVLA